jgi:hypothetical protein
MDVAVVICNTSDPAPPMPAGWRLLATAAEPVNRVPADRLKEFLAADFERLLFTDGRDLRAGRLPASNRIVIDPFGSHSRRFSPNPQAPNWLAIVAVTGDDSSEVLLPRDVLARVDALQNQDESVWEWVCRAVFAGESAQWETSPAADEFPPKLPALAPSSPDRVSRVIEPLLKAGVEKLCGRIASQHDAIALRAGILQLHDDLDGSHELSQSIEGLGRRHAGDYWHAIMHCREGDFGNSKYWRRHVGRHPLFEDLAPLADGILAKCASPAAAGWRAKVAGSGSWDPYAFIDLCETCVRGRDADLTRAAEEIQFAEMHLLLAATYEDACGG